MADSDINGHLMKACEEGDLETVVRLLEEGADKQCRDGAGRTLLHLAAAGGHIDVIRWLTENASADVTAVDEDLSTPLHDAAAWSHVDVVRWLTENASADVTAVDDKLCTPLHRAAARGHVDVVRCLVREASADVTAVDGGGSTLLHHAAGRGHIDVVRWLVREASADVTAVDGLGSTPLHDAAARGHVDVVRCLVQEASADVTAVNDYGSTPLHRAAAGGHLDVVRYLMWEASADVTAVDGYGRTPLHLAAREGHVDVVRCLVREASADVTAVNKYGRTPLHLAAAGGHVDVVRCLVREASADVTALDQYGGTPLHHAAGRGHIDVVRWLVREASADVTAVNKYGSTPLHHAAAGGHVDIVRCLVREASADVTAVTQGGSTPLHHAAAGGHVDIVRCLVREASADVTAVTQYGSTPLHHAAEAGHVDVVRCLVREASADVTAVNKGGSTPLHHAAEAGHVDVVRSLVLEASADVTAVDRNGDTPMHLAIQFRSSSQYHDSGLSLVQLLWESGAKINCQNKKQETPLDLAVQENDTEVMTFLLSVGADVDLLDQHFIHIRSRFGGQRLLDFVTAECLQGYSGETTRWQCFKTVILGEVESGKTSLRKTMKYRKPHLTEKPERTVGVEQDVIFLDDHLQSCFLDFGGHETYTFLHQACMTNQTVICIAVDTPKYENKDFPKCVGQWYLKAVSRVFQPYIMIIGTKAETCSEEDLERKQAHIMKSLQTMQKKQNSTFEDNIQNLESKLNDVLNLLAENEEQKTEMIENEEEFIKQVKQFANAHPRNASKINFIFSRSPGINMSNIMSEINFTKQCLEKQPKVHKQMLFVSSESMKGIEELRNTICTVVRDNESLFPVFDIPVAWRNVIQAIPTSEPLLSKDKFKELCKSKEIRDITLIDKLLGYLKAAGIVFQYDDHRPLSELENVIFLKPNWIFEIIGHFYNHFYLSGEKGMPAIEEILESLNLTEVDLQYVHVELKRSGIMSEKVIKYILRKCDVTKDKIKYVLGLLVYLDICCLHVASSEPDSQERKYRFPFLLPETPDPVSAYEWPAKCPDDLDEYHLHVYFDSPVDLPGLFDKWSIRTNDHFVKRFDWKKGCIAVLKDGCGKVRILNHSSDSEGDVHYSVCARVKPEKSATMRNVLQTIQIQLWYIHQQYPYTVMKSWVVCPACEIPGQWPMDKIIKIQPEEDESVTCDKCGTSMPIHRLFPMHSDRSIGGLTDFRFELFLGLSGDVEKLAVELLGGSYAKEVLKEAKTKYPHNIEEHCALVLKKWSQSFSTDATFRRLVEALLEIRRKDLADIIEKRFRKEVLSLDRPWDYKPSKM